MKKSIFFFSLVALAIVLGTNNTLAQTTPATTDSNSVASKSNQIVSLLTSKLGLTKAQVPVVQALVTKFSERFSKTNAAVAKSGGGVKEKVAKQEQAALEKDFSNELPKTLDATQKTKFTAIKDQVNALFTQIK